MAFPNNKAHRVQRRKLGRGQHVQLPAVTASLSYVTTTGPNNTNVMQLTFNTPAVVIGSLDFKPAGNTFVSQVQVSPNVWNLTYANQFSSAVAATYAGIPAGSPLIASPIGGAFAGIPAGTMALPLSAVVSFVSFSGSTNYGQILLTFNQPATVVGNLDIGVAAHTFVSQSQVSPTVWSLTYTPMLTSTSTNVTYAGLPDPSLLAFGQMGAFFVGLPQGTL